MTEFEHCVVFHLYTGIIFYYYNSCLCLWPFFLSFLCIS